jgi:hypothetical protein
MPDLRLISADFLKLRRRRGMLSLTLLGTLGVVALVFAVTAIQHAANPAGYGPVGGLETYADAIGVVGLLALVAGVIVGGTAARRTLSRACFAIWLLPPALAPRCSSRGWRADWPWYCRPCS